MGSMTMAATVDEIVHKRIIEENRSEIHAAYMAALEDRRNGRTKTGCADDLFGAVG